MAKGLFQRMFGAGPYVGWGGTGGINGGAYPGAPPPWSTPPFNPNNPQPLPMPIPGPIPMPPSTGGGAMPSRPLIPSAGKGPAWLQKLTGGFNKFTGGLAGVQNNPNLSQQENEAIANQQRQAFMGALLAGSGPAPVGTRGLLQPFGDAMLVGQKHGADLAADAMRAKLMQAQIAQAQQGGQDRADPNVIRALVLAGIDPQSPQGQEIVIKSLTGGNDALAQIQAQLAVDQRRDQLERDRAADAKTAEADRVARVKLGNTLRGGITQTGELADLTQRLEGTLLEAGVPLSSIRRSGVSVLAGLGSAVGMDTRQLETDIGNFDKLKKGMSDQLINLVGSGDLGQGTNAKLQQYQNALATTETSPAAIMSIQAGIAQTLLEEADAQGVDVPGREQIEANIKAWRKYESPQGAAVVDLPEMIKDVKNFARLSIEQIREIDIDSLTQEQRNALAKRLDELGL